MTAGGGEPAVSCATGQGAAPQLVVTGSKPLPSTRR